MKLSISLASSDVDFLDSYASQHGIPSRSAAVQRALRLLRQEELGSAYEEAWDEWSSSEDGSAWESTAADGLPQR